MGRSAGRAIGAALLLLRSSVICRGSEQHDDEVVDAVDISSNSSLPAFSRVVAPAEQSLQHLHGVAQMLRRKAAVEYEGKKAQIATLRQRYQSSLQAMHRHSIDLQSAQASLQKNNSALGGENRKTMDEALSVQAQNHARMQVVHKLKQRLASATSFLNEASLRNLSDTMAEVAESITQRAVFQDFLDAARREMGVASARMEATIGPVSSTVLLQTGVTAVVAKQGAKPDVSVLEDKVHAEYEIENSANVVHDMIRSLSSNLETMNNATLRAQQKLEASYDASAKNYSQRHEAMTHSIQQGLDEQHRALILGARLRAATGYLKSMSSHIGDRLSSLRTFMQHASAAAARAVERADAALEANA